MVWVSGLVSAGLGAAGGIMGAHEAGKLKKRREPFLRTADQLGQGLVSDLNLSIARQQEISNRGFQKANAKLARSGYAQKRQAVLSQRKATGRAIQRGIDTGLMNSSVFQGARRGITAETSALLASITQDVAARRAQLDLNQAAADTALEGARGDVRSTAYDLGMQSQERWLMHQTGAGFGQLPQAQGMDFSGLGNMAKYLAKGTAPDGSKSLLDWLF